MTTDPTFRDLLNPYVHFDADDGMPGLRIAEAADILRTPVPWVDCPTCHNQFDGKMPGHHYGSNWAWVPCQTCMGTGKATVAQLLAWGQAAAQTDPEDWIEFSDQRSAVVGYRNRILDTLP